MVTWTSIVCAAYLLIFLVNFRGWTLDLECNPEITGDKVKITLSGQRQLELAEVEVFTSNSPTPSTSPTSESCYDGVRYATAACAECTGPGPSQCISCDDDAVLVPFRANNHSSTNFTLAGNMIMSGLTRHGDLTTILVPNCEQALKGPVQRSRLIHSC